MCQMQYLLCHHPLLFPFRIDWLYPQQLIVHLLYYKNKKLHQFAENQMLLHQ